MCMAVANAVRQDRPSTRSTRGTKDTGERNKGTRNTTRSTVRDRNVESLNDRRVRSSTRGGKEQEPRRKASTRNRTAVDPANPITRKRASTRGGSGSAQAKHDHSRVESPPSNDSSARPSRAEVFEERREAKRFVAPIQFLLVMFMVMVVSVFAFSLLRGDPVAQLPGPDRGGDHVETIYRKDGTTSTNTGILRGN